MSFLIVVALVLGVLGVFLAFLAAKEDGVLLLVAVVVLFLSSMAVRYSGYGNLPDDRGMNYLVAGEVRETVCTRAIKDGNGRVAALLQKPDGSFEARELRSDPPKRFVKTGEPSPSYVPYP